MVNERVWVVAGALLWLIGGNLVTARHYQRRGLSGWSGLKTPWKVPRFSVGEWLVVGALAAAALTLMALGLRPD